MSWILVSQTHLIILAGVVKECLENPKGTGYIGTASKTKSGLTCQRWDSQKPHGHKLESLGDQENYCRNPGSNERLSWCYTTSADKRWEYCDIPLCGKNYSYIYWIGGVWRLGSLGGDENYWRNAGNNERLPWCYTTSEDKRWEYCDIPYVVSRHTKQWSVCITTDCDMINMFLYVKHLY